MSLSSLFDFGASANPKPGFGFGISPSKPVTTPEAPTKPPVADETNPWAIFGRALAGIGAAHSGIDIPRLLTALRHDPQGDANKGYVPGVDNQSNPFSNGFFKNSAAQLSPEARQASQGNSAMTQWGLLGQVPGLDAGKLAAATPVQAQAPATPSVNQFSDPYFLAHLQKMFAPQQQMTPGVSLTGLEQPTKPQVRKATAVKKPGFNLAL